MLDIEKNTDLTQLKADFQPKNKLSNQESLQQPVWHVIILSFLTCFAYPIYWFYKNWRDLARQAAKKDSSLHPVLSQYAGISPLLRTLGLLIPLVDVYLAFKLVYSLAKLHPDSSSLPSRQPLLASILIVGSMIALLMLVVLPGSFYLLSFAASIPLAVAQSWLNYYWQSVERPSATVRQMFTGKEFIAITVGSLWLGLILAAPLIKA